MTKRCTDCGIIFQTDDPEKTRCDLCEDDRKAEEDADRDYEKFRYRIQRYSRWCANAKPGVLRSFICFLVRLMYWLNENGMKGV